MQMHIVSKRKDLTLDDAIKTSNGLAVLGFFIEVTLISNKNVTLGANFKCTGQNQNDCAIKRSIFMKHWVEKITRSNWSHFELHSAILYSHEDAHDHVLSTCSFYADNL